MRLGGLFLLLILSYFFNPIEPIVEDTVIIDLTEIDHAQPISPDELDASIIIPSSLCATV